MGVSPVLSLRAEDVGQASGVIACAFHADALTVHLYPDDETRGRLAPLMFEALVRYDHLFGQVDYLPGVTAVATWLRPAKRLRQRIVSPRQALTISRTTCL